MCRGPRTQLSNLLQPMPAKKNSKPRQDKATHQPTTDEAPPPREKREPGLSGQGSGSALIQMLEQERVRTRRPEPNSG